MNVFIFSKDSTILKSGKDVFGDTRKRHIEYVRELRRRFPGSSIRIICYTPYKNRYAIDNVEDGLVICPTNSLHRALYLYDSIRIFIRLLREGKPDLLTVQTPYEEGFLGLLLSKIFKIKFLPQVHFDLFSDDWKAEHWLNGWRREVSLWVCKHSDGVRVVSSVIKEKMVSKLGVDERKLFIIPVGVNFSPISKVERQEECKVKLKPDWGGKKVILFAGRFCAQKNLDLWIEVAKRVIDKNSDARFIMCGDGELFSYIKSLVTEMGLAEYFHFPGKVGHLDLPEYYAAADVFLLTSFYEGLPRVVNESYISGVPVVSTKATGPSEMIENCKTGYLHDFDDVEGLAGSVAKIIGDEALAKIMGTAGKEKVMQEFSKEALIKRLVDCWITLCI